MATSRARDHSHFVKTIFVLLFAFWPAAGTGCNTAAKPPLDNKTGVPLELKAVDVSGINATSVPAGSYVFRKSAEWRDFWAKYSMGNSPKIDFAKFSALAIFLGQRPNTGYSVKILEAREYKQAVVVKAAEYLPAPGMMYAQLIVYPFDIVLIPKTDKGVRFETTKLVGQP